MQDRFLALIARSRSFRVNLRVLLLAGLVVIFRLVLAGVLPRTIHYDEPIYLLLGINLLSGKGYTSWEAPELHFPPLYPLVAGASYLLTRDLEWAGNLPYAVFGGLLLIPVFALARRIYGTRTAWAACIFVALFPALNVSVLYWGSMTEPLFLFLLFSGAAALLAGLETGRLPVLAAAGGLLGLAYLTRPEAVGYFAVSCFAVLLWPANGSSIATRLRKAAIFSGVFLLLAAPYVLYLKQHTGQWMLSGKGSLSWELGGERGQTGKGYDWLILRLDSAQQEVYWHSQERFRQSSGLREALLADPLGVLKRVGRNASDLPAALFDWHAFWFGLLILLGLGLFGDRWDRARLRRELLLFAWLLPLAGLLFFRLVLRFYAPAFPLLLLWSAHGAVVLGIRLQQTAENCWPAPPARLRLHRLLRTAPAGLVILFFLLISASLAADHQNSLFFGYKKAAHWLARNSPPSARVMARETAVGLYASRQHVPFPNAEWELLRDYARRHRTDYLVATERELTDLRPQLRRLMHRDMLPSELRLVHQFQESGQQVFIFRFVWHEAARTAARSASQEASHPAEDTQH